MTYASNRKMLLLDYSYYYIDKDLENFLYDAAKDAWFRGTFSPEEHPKTMNNLMRVLNDHNVNTITEFYELYDTMHKWPGVGRYTIELLDAIYEVAVEDYDDKRMAVIMSENMLADEEGWVQPPRLTYEHDNFGRYNGKDIGRPYSLCIHIQQAFADMYSIEAVTKKITEHIEHCWNPPFTITVCVNDSKYYFTSDGQRIGITGDPGLLSYDYMYIVRNGHYYPRFIKIMEATCSALEIPYTTVTF